MQVHFYLLRTFRYSVSTSWVGDENEGATSAQVYVNQPILDPYSIYTRLSVLNSQEDLNDIKKKQKRLLVIYAARMAYFDVLYWKNSFETANTLYKQSKLDFLDIEKRYKRGLASREDVIRFQLSYENFKQQKENRSQSLWRSVDVISILTGKKIDSKQIVFKNKPKFFALARAELKKRLSKAKSIDVLVKKDEYELARSKYKDSKTNHIPTISAFYQKALEEVQYSYNGATAGLSLNWDVFSGLNDYNENRSSYYDMLQISSDLTYL